MVSLPRLSSFALAVSLFALAVSPAPRLAPALLAEESASRDDQEWRFEVPAKGESKVYERPADAEYFWWDTEGLEVALKFDDGSLLKAGADREFSKRIVSVQFINSGSKPVPVVLRARF